MTALEATEAALRRLLAEVRADLSLASEVAARVAAARGGSSGTPCDEAARAYLAVELHRYYSAIEAAFERISRVVDGLPPAGDSWHRDLLRQMSLDVPGVRPAVIEPAVAGDLSHLLSFRHFFRHAYAVELDWTHLSAHQTRVGRVHPEVLRGVERVLAHLEAVLASLDREA